MSSNGPLFPSTGISANLMFPLLQGEGWGGDGVDCDWPDKQKDTVGQTATGVA